MMSILTNRISEVIREAGMADVVSSFLAMVLVVGTVSSAPSQVTIQIEPAVVFTSSTDNELVLTAVTDPFCDMAGIDGKISFDTDCFTVTSIRKTDRSEGMGVFAFSHTSGGIHIVIAGRGHAIAPGRGPIAFIEVDVGGCSVGVYPWTVEYLWSSTCEMTPDERGYTSAVVQVRGGRGDVNDDGRIDIQDVMSVVNHMLRNELFPEDEARRADWNNDELINALDVVGIIKEILRLTGQFWEYAQGFWEPVGGDTADVYWSGFVDSDFFAMDTKTQPDSVLVTWEEWGHCWTKSGVMNSSGGFLIDDGRFPEEGATSAEFHIVSEKDAHVTFFLLLHNWVHVYEKALVKTSDDSRVVCF